MHLFRLQNTIDDLLNQDWLIENPEWNSADEERDIKNYLRNVITECGTVMFQHLKDLKMLDRTKPYRYKKAISDHVFLFQRC